MMTKKMEMKVKMKMTMKMRMVEREFREFMELLNQIILLVVWLTRDTYIMNLPSFLL